MLVFTLLVRKHLDNIVLPFSKNITNRLLFSKRYLLGSFVNQKITLINFYVYWLSWSKVWSFLKYFLRQRGEILWLTESPVIHRLFFKALTPVWAVPVCSLWHGGSLYDMKFNATFIHDFSNYLLVYVSPAGKVSRVMAEAWRSSFPLFIIGAEECAPSAHVRHMQPTFFIPCLPNSWGHYYFYLLVFRTLIQHLAMDAARLLILRQKRYF